MPDALWTNSTTYDAQELRRATAMQIMTNGSARGGRSGIRPGSGGYDVSVSGTTITVTPGVMAVSGPSGEGVYICPLDASFTLTLTAANATLPRIDLVYLRVWDTDLDGTGLRKAEPVYLAGTAASTPVAPTIPAGQTGVELATISVPASGGGSPSVSQTIRPNTVAPGGILPAATAPTNTYVGLYWDDGTNLRRWNGSSWDTYQRMPGAWTSWTPTWTTSTGAHTPSWGNATVDCRYTKLGRLVIYSMNIAFGSTTNFGSGVVAADNWTFSLPVTAAATNYPIGKASMEPGASRGVSGLAQTNTDGTSIMIHIDSGAVNGSTVAAGVVDSLSPWTWVSGNRLTIVGQYESTT
jgi:hypothetical protein